MNFITGNELLQQCDTHNKSISQLMLERECSLFKKTEQQIKEQMFASYKVMKKGVKKALEEDLVSMGRLLGGESKKVYTRYKEGKSFSGELFAKANSYALGILEVNASMGLIVAAPTAGSSGVIPGALIALQETLGLPDEKMIEGLLNAGAIGYLITRNATVSGAEGGCQAEVGVASSMAASAVCEIMGGSSKECLEAASVAITNLLGLICDPIGGLVEAPCQKRNSLGATNALISAEMILSGIHHPIPFDETVDVMYKVGKSMPIEHRETALGGIAVTPTACQMCAMH